jgi:hypothetical protein
MYVRFSTKITDFCLDPINNFQMVCNMVHTNVCEILYKDSLLNLVPHKNMLMIGNPCLGDNKLA